MLADGFHRYHAHFEVGTEQIDATSSFGIQREAVLYSVGANCAHGLRRSNEDKRKAISTLLADAERAQWSDNHIAKGLWRFAYVRRRPTPGYLAADSR